MPVITAAGTYTKNTPGFEFLGGSREVRTILIAGATLPTTLEIKYDDDEGVEQLLEGGTITALPTSKKIDRLKRAVKIVVTGGSPNFSICGA